MDRAPAVGILLAIPVFVALFGGEYLLGRVRRRDWYPSALDVYASVTSGLWNLAIAGTGLVFAVVGYDWMVDHVAVVHLGTSLVGAALTLVLIDFGSYWLHRAMHRSNALWQLHLVHHSSESLNLTVALRQGGTPLSLRFLILAPIALLGVDARVVVLVGGLHLAGTYWQHTRAFDHLGPLGALIITPSDHRIHHAINAGYLDCNYGAWFSVWDRWFGTYRPQRADDPPMFGLTHPVRTFNPLRMDLHHWRVLALDTVRASSAADRLRIWFGPTGWRPADVAAAHPIASLSDDEARRRYERFEPDADRLANAWSFVETTVQAMLTVGLFWAMAQGHLTRVDTVAYVALLLVSIVTYTTAMDGRPHLALELGRVALAAGLALTLAGPTWFGLGDLVGGAPVAIGVVAFYAVAVLVERVAVRRPAPDLSPAPAAAVA